MKVNEKCPGEEVCVEDKIQGECGKRGTTLEEHCHSDMVHGGCKLWYTKRGTTPVKFRGLCDAVFVCRARQKSGLDLTNYPMPYWAEKAHIIGTSVYTQVENSGNEQEDDGWMVLGAGDTDAFKLINQHMREMNAKKVN